MLDIAYTKSFKRAFKKLNNDDQEATKQIIKRLAYDETLESKHKDHALIGNYKGFRECHIKPDLLLVYKK